MRDSNQDSRGLGIVPGTPPLADTVSNFGEKISVYKTGNNTFELAGLDEEFETNQYVWFHERGYTAGGLFDGKEVPARPFIAPGVNEAMAYAVAVVMNRTPIDKAHAGLTKPMTYTKSMGMVGAMGWGGAAGSVSVPNRAMALPTQYISPSYVAASKKSMQDSLLFLWWFMPQVSEYKYFAYIHDLIGYMSGHFMTMETVRRFVTNLTAGKMGQITGVPMTTKLARRTSRKALWGSQSVSITGV